MMRTTTALVLCGAALALAACGERTCGRGEEIRRAGLGRLDRSRRLQHPYLEGGRPGQLGAADAQPQPVAERILARAHATLRR